MATKTPDLRFTKNDADSCAMPEEPVVNETASIFEPVKYQLKVLDGGQAKHQIIQLKKHVPMYVGRAIGCQIDLNDISISRRHCVFQYKEFVVDSGGKNTSGYCVYDLKSTHGTFLNDERIPQMQNILLRHGDCLKFGAFSSSFIFEDIEKSRSENAETTTSDNAVNTVHSTTETTERSTEQLLATMDHLINKINVLVDQLNEIKNDSIVHQLKTNLEQCLKRIDKNVKDNTISDLEDELETELWRLHSNHISDRSTPRNMVEIPRHKELTYKTFANGKTKIPPSTILESTPSQVAKTLSNTIEQKPSTLNSTSSQSVGLATGEKRSKSYANIDPLADFVLDADPFASIPEFIVPKRQFTEKQNQLSVKSKIENEKNQFQSLKSKQATQPPTAVSINDEKLSSITESPVAPKKRGRPKKSAVQPDIAPKAIKNNKSKHTTSNLAEQSAPRPIQLHINLPFMQKTTNELLKTPVSIKGLPVPKKRGRPPKNQKAMDIPLKNLQGRKRNAQTDEAFAESLPLAKKARSRSKKSLPESVRDEPNFSTMLCKPGKLSVPAQEQSKNIKVSKSRSQTFKPLETESYLWSPVTLETKKCQPKQGQARSLSKISPKIEDNELGRTRGRRRNLPKKLLDDEYESDPILSFLASNKPKTKKDLDTTKINNTKTGKEKLIRKAQLPKTFKNQRQQFDDNHDIGSKRSRSDLKVTR